MGYEQSIQCKLLATNCVCCGRPLVDAQSVELGIGPECRKHITWESDIDEDERKIANEHIYNASIAATHGAVQEVLDYAALIEHLGLASLAEKVRRRFVSFLEQAKRKPSITIREFTYKDKRTGVDVRAMSIKTPYKRSQPASFTSAWRSIPGRWWDRKRRSNIVPITSSNKQAVWNLLKQFFPGLVGMGPKGAFRVPRENKQQELNLQGGVK